MSRKTGAERKAKPRMANSRGGPTIPLDTRQDAEAVARWVEAMYASYPEQIAKALAWLREHPEDKTTAAHLHWLRHALSTSQQIAYYLRTHRVRGPLV
jgi:hypothetical protein